MLGQQQAAVTGSTHTRRPKSLKIEISKYAVCEVDSMWAGLLILMTPYGSSHRRWVNAGPICSIELGRTCKDLGLGPHATRPICLRVVKVSKSLLRQTFKPPRAESRDPCTLLKLKQGKRGVHSLHSVHTSSYELHYSKSDEWKNVDYVVHAGYNDGPIRTYLFRL